MVTTSSAFELQNKLVDLVSPMGSTLSSLAKNREITATAAVLKLSIVVLVELQIANDWLRRINIADDWGPNSTMILPQNGADLRT